MPGPVKDGKEVSVNTAVRRYFDVCLYTLVLTGFATLAATGGLDAPTVLLVGLALFVRGYFLLPGRTVFIPERWTTYLTLAYAGFYVVDYFLLSGAFLSSTVHLVLFGMVVRLFSAQQERDHYMLAVLSFLMVLAAAVLTVDSLFLFSFAVFMLMAVVTFVLMEMRHSIASTPIHAKESSEARAHQRLAVSLASAAPLLMLAILCGASVIFFILPRVSSHYLSSYASTSDLSTGFSDRVQLGRIGQIQQSNAVVMHIQIEGDKSGLYDLKWRGVALSNFDGRAWSNPLEQTVLLRLPDGSFPLLPSRSARAFNDNPPLPRSTPVHYRVMMEPMGSNVFFLAPRAGTLQGNYRMVSIDSASAVYDLDPEHPVTTYEAFSNIARPPLEQLRSSADIYPPAVLITYLQLPSVDPRIRQLAAEITAREASNYDKAVAIERYLMSHYSYTLQLPRTTSRDPLADFLFERKRGHCEYFASAMAVMLRSLRIPARVVNGFRTGEFNDVTSNYVVRASNAHSWVEAYFPGSGWVSFDPTPPAPASAHNAWDRAMLYVDAMASFWREWIINYDASHQKTLGQEAGRGSRALVESMRMWYQHRYGEMLKRARKIHNAIASSPVRWSMTGLAITAILLLLANLRRLLRSLRNYRLRGHPERAPRLAATIWYEKMSHSLARQGWHKRPTETPSEFAAAIDDPAIRGRVVRFTRHYESARFGASTEDAQQLPQLYEEVASAGQKR